MRSSPKPNPISIDASRQVMVNDNCFLTQQCQLRSSDDIADELSSSCRSLPAGHATAIRFG